MPCVPTIARAVAAVFFFPLALAAQSSLPVAADSATGVRRAPLKPVTVTATRSATDVRDVAAPVLVIDSLKIRSQLSTGLADLLRSESGVDVVGTGVNQSRPSIRGQRGQRILLLEDGMRLNNSRRQQDFGEIPSVVDVDQLARIEVVRGPASVLYGTDAIGGVVNLITRMPAVGDADKLTGRVGYQYGGAGTLSKTSVTVSARYASWALDISGSARVAGDYDAPAGRYGKVKLSDNTTLRNSGVRDQNVAGTVAWRASEQANAFAKYERYAADDAGFGYVPAALIGGDQTLIDIRYPRQEFGKFSTGVHLTALGLPVADQVDITAYRQKNTRDLAQHIFALFGPGTPKGAGIDITTANFTDITSTGFRAEASKVTGKAIVTYGMDFFSDQSINRDTSKTTIVGFGPPMHQYSGRPQVPNATLTSYGAFVQTDFRLHERFSLIVGGRSQQVESSPKATAGRTDLISNHSNGTRVYAANAVYKLHPNASIVATVGRGFRSPNLVERYYEGPTPEGSAYQKSAPDLLAETSLNYDGGIKFRNDWLTADVSLFQNDIRDGIMTTPTGAKQGTLPVYTNVNVGKLRAKGAEFSAIALIGQGFLAGANYSTVKSTNVAQPAVPVTDTYSSKTNVSLGWTQPNGRLWAEYAVRRNGEQKDLIATASPVGPSLPAFVVQNVRAGIRGWTIGSMRQELTVGLNNIANVLYTEAANATFFRPEPGRHLVLSLSTTF